MVRRRACPPASSRVQDGLVSRARRGREGVRPERTGLFLCASAGLPLTATLSEGPTNSRWLTCLLHCAALPAGFSNGCAIGCKTCDGFSRGPIPWGSFKKDPFWDRKFNLCPVGAANSTQVAGKPTATICDPNLRTINTHGADVPNGRNRCGGPDDWYYYSPWRAPGKKQFQHVIDDFLWFSAEFH